MLLGYLHYTPVLTTPADVADTAAFIGRATAGRGLTLRPYATLRADGEAVRVGSNVYFGERATVHIEDATLAADVGNDVTVGRYAIVHACTVEDGVVVGDAAVVMDEAVVGPYALIAAGALVPPRKHLAGGWLYAGHPATAVRAIDRAEVEDVAASIRGGHPAPAVYDPDLPPLDPRKLAPTPASVEAVHAMGARAERIGRAYIAPTAVVAGDVTFEDDVGVYFGCVVLAGDGGISIGRGSNIQDNSHLIPSGARGSLRIGGGVTVGHNVRMGSATIEDDALVGMGSQLGDGVVVEAGACVAARALVEPGTVIRSGWIWAGRPARAFRELKSAERESFAQARDIYIRYANAYRAGQT